MKVRKIRFVERKKHLYENDFEVLELAYLGLLWVPHSAFEFISKEEALFLEMQLEFEKPTIVEWVYLDEDGNKDLQVRF